MVQAAESTACPSMRAPSSSTKRTWTSASRAPARGQRDQPRDARLGVGGQRAVVEGRPGGRGHRHLELSEVCGSLVPGEGVAQAVQRLGGRGGGEGVPVPAVTPGHRPSERRGDVAADVQRRSAGAQRPRFGPHPGERDVRPVVPVAAVPHDLHGVQGFVGAAAPMGQRHAQRLELGGEVPHPDAEQEAAVGHPVERRHLLGQHQRMVPGHDRDARAEAQRAGVGRQVGQRHERVEHGQVGPGGRRRHGWVGQDVVLAGPHALPPCVFGRPGDADRGTGVGGADVDVDEEQSELHVGNVRPASTCHQR